MVDRTLAFMLVCFPLALYIVVFAFVHHRRRRIDEQFAYLDDAAAAAAAAEPGNRWRNAIMPYTPLPHNAPSAYYADDITPEGWAAMLRSLTDLDKGSKGWQKVPASGAPSAVLEGSMEAVATRLSPDGWRPVKVAVDAAYASGSGRKGEHAWDVVACFHRSGKARGWCARLRATADVSAGDPRRWTYGIEGPVEPLGTISEDVILTRAAVDDEALLLSSSSPAPSSSF
jgi:hypothetical protein